MQQVEPFNQLFNSSSLPLRPAKSSCEGLCLWGSQCNWEEKPSVWKGGPVSNYKLQQKLKVRKVCMGEVREGFLE